MLGRRVIIGVTSTRPDIERLKAVTQINKGDDKMKHQRFKLGVIRALQNLGPATWPEIKFWMFENLRGAGRIIPTSGQVGGILGHMPEIEQKPQKLVRIRHSLATSTAAYAVWSLREGVEY